MNEIDLRRFDLNLLVVFDVLMTERSVTRAAERLGRTQSAISHSLSRLRDQFGDPLLLKSGVRHAADPARARTDRAGASDAGRPPTRPVAAACVRCGHLEPRVPTRRAGFHADAVCGLDNAAAIRGTRYIRRMDLAEGADPARCGRRPDRHRDRA